MVKGSRQGTAKLTTAKQRIKSYLCGDDIRLKPEDLIILARWEKCDLLYRQGNEFADIVKQIAEEHSVTRWTAQLDFFDTQEVFTAARKINKKYHNFLNYERQLQDIKLYREKIFGLDRDKNPDPKEIIALTKMEENLRHTLNSIPDETEKPPFVPTKVVLNLVQEDTIVLDSSLDQLLLKADNYLKGQVIEDAEVIQMDADDSGKE